MAAVEVMEFEEFEESDERPYLRLVTHPAGLSHRPDAGEAPRGARADDEAASSHVLGLGLVLGLVILAWPGHAFGGETGAGLPTDLANSSVLASGMDYVVQPGDTINSIARMMNPVDPNVRPAPTLVRELDSSVVVPGEHVLIP